MAALTHSTPSSAATTGHVARIAINTREEEERGEREKGEKKGRERSVRLTGFTRRAPHLRGTCRAALSGRGRHRNGDKGRHPTTTQILIASHRAHEHGWPLAASSQPRFRRTLCLPPAPARSPHTHCPSPTSALVRAAICCVAPSVSPTSAPALPPPQCAQPAPSTASHAEHALTSQTCRFRCAHAPRASVSTRRAVARLSIALPRRTARAAQPVRRTFART